MSNKTQYTLAGLFVLVLGFALIAGVLWLSAGGTGRAHNTYLVYMTESVAGLSRDGAVKYRGVDVGRIQDIQLAPDNPEVVRLLLEIEEGTPIKQDTVATLEAQGLTGLAYINLLGGSREAPPLTAEGDQEYPVIPSRPSLWGRIDQNVGELIENLIESSKSMKELLNSQNRALITRTLQNLDTLSGSLAARTGTVDDALDDLATALRNFRHASEGLPDLVAQLQRSAGAMENMARELSAAGGELRQTVQARSSDLARFTSGALPDAAVMIQELRQTAENLRRLSASLQRDPSVLLRGSTPPPPGPGE